MTDNNHPITPPPPHLLKKFSAQAQDEAKKRHEAGYLKAFATLCIEWAMNSKTTPNDRQIRSSEITPPPELIEEWIELSRLRKDRSPNPNVLATYAARWGADTELDACCAYISRWFATPEYRAAELRAARRPKPQSLKEEALEALKHAEEGWRPIPADCKIIRRALESLPD